MLAAQVLDGYARVCLAQEADDLGFRESFSSSDPFSQGPDSKLKRYSKPGGRQYLHGGRCRWRRTRWTCGSA